MNDTLLKKYLLYSLGFHCLIIVLGILLSHSTTIRHTFVVLGAHSKKRSLTLFKPFNVKPVVSQNNNALVQRSVKSVSSVVKKIPEQKKVQPTKKAPTVKSSPIKPVEKQAPGISFENSKQKKVSTLAEQKKKELIKKEPMKKAQQSQPVKKIVAQKKQEVQIQKPEAKVEKKINVIKNNAKEFEAEKKAEQKNTSEQMERFEQSEQLEEDAVAVVFTDRDIMLYQHIVQKEIGQRWQPPLGVPKGTQCTIRFEISDNGSVKNAELVRNSAVLIFDLSAVRSARTCTFMQCLWGKTFQVDFRQ